MKKIILPIIFTILFTFVLLFVFNIDMRSELSNQMSSAFSFTLQTEGLQEEISVWAEDDFHYYVFFPSHAGLSAATVHLNTTTELFLNGHLLTDDFDLSRLEYEIPYELSYSFYGTMQTAQLTFLQSANVATMYIHTETGSMDKIHLDKDYKENADIILVDTKGNINYAGRGNDELKGRGNYSWYSAKKPYTLQLYEANALLNMAVAEKWVLLSNSTDVSNIRNKLVYDFAENTDLYWTPDCEYVDLYLNGEYAGLYVLTEKIEVSESRLDLDENAYLFAIESAVAESNFGIRFSTDTGQQIELKNPSDLTDQEMADFENYIQSIENMILNGSNDLFENIDLDSWVRKYLIEEIFFNLDAGLNSQFFYRDENSSVKIFAGPIWDYDRSLGNQSGRVIAVQNPKCFYASTSQKSAVWDTPWFTALCDHEIFHNRLVEIYQSEYLPLLEDLISTDINSLSIEIEKAATNNNIRWASLFTTKGTYKEEIEYIEYFLQERVAFLNCAWIDGMRYCTIRIDTGPERYSYLNVEPGEVIDTLPSPKELGVSESEVWYIDGTDVAFDVTKPIESDLFLRTQTASELKSGQQLFMSVLTKIKDNMYIILLLIPAGMLCIIMLILLAVDWRRNQRKKVKTYEQRP